MQESKHSQRLGTAPVGPLLIRMAVPAALAMLVQSSYSLVDTIFIGRGVGQEAIGALAIFFPLQRIFQGANTLLGVGAASIVSRCLGAGDPERAERTTGSILGLAFVLGWLVAIGGRVFLDPILTVLGAMDQLRTLARQYIAVVLLDVPFFLVNGSAILMIRAEGRARMAMAAMVMGTSINIVLDPIFIFVLGWGIQGAALATVIGRVAATVVILIHFATRKTGLRFRIKNILPDRSILAETLSIGASSFARQFTYALLFAINNHTLGLYGGAIYLSAFASSWRLLLFLGMPVAGLFQGFRPIVGYNHGAGRDDRVRRVLLLSMLGSAAYLLLPLAAMEFFPRTLIGLFSKDPALLTVGSEYMRVFAWIAPTFGSTIVAAALYQALGKPWRALFMSVLQPAVGIPLLLLAGPLLGLPGVIMAFPASFAVYAVLALAVILFWLRKHRS